MDNVEITVKLNGKDVPLDTISTETFEKIKNNKLFGLGEWFEYYGNKFVVVRNADGKLGVIGFYPAGDAYLCHDGFVKCCRKIDLEKDYNGWTEGNSVKRIEKPF